MDLVRSLERLPLALHVVARLLRVESKFDWGVEDLLNEITEGAAIIEAQAAADRVKGENIPTVTAVLQRSTNWWPLPEPIGYGRFQMHALFVMHAPLLND
ncbi:MAG: hypothetical protein AABN95_01985 [Acidobacteriota bacterium]